MKILDWIGKRFLRFFTFFGLLATSGLVAFGGLFRPAFKIKNYLIELVRVGADSSLVVIVTAFFTGMVLALQAWIGFRRFNAESLVGAVVSLSMTRELGPVITGLMVAGRSGSAMAAELGTMRVTEQIDAFTSLAVDPKTYLMTPRVYAGLTALPLLTALADLVGIAGGYFVAVTLLGLPHNSYVRGIAEYVNLHDFYSGLVKSAVFGGLLSLLSCHMGFYASGGAAGVGRSVTVAVVASSMAILIGDYFLTSWLY